MRGACLGRLLAADSSTQESSVNGKANWLQQKNCRLTFDISGLPWPLFREDGGLEQRGKKDDNTGCCIFSKQAVFIKRLDSPKDSVT